MTKIVLSPDSLLVIDKSGTIKRIKCPFDVRLLYPISVLTVNELYKVQSVAQNRDGVLVFFVLGYAYFYYNFSIELE